MALLTGFAARGAFDRQTMGRGGRRLHAGNGVYRSACLHRCPTQRHAARPHPHRCEPDQPKWGRLAGEVGGDQGHRSDPSAGAPTRPDDHKGPLRRRAQAAAGRPGEEAGERRRNESGHPSRRAAGTARSASTGRCRCPRKADSCPVRGDAGSVWRQRAREPCVNRPHERVFV